MKKGFLLPLHPLLIHKLFIRGDKEVDSSLVEVKFRLFLLTVVIKDDIMVS